MKTCVRVLRIPSLVLAGALQVLPIARVALPAAEATANILAIVFRWAAGVAATLGGVQAVSGASTVITSPLTATAVQGQPFSMRLATAPNQAQYWTATGLPAGITLSGQSGSTLWQLIGTPTVTGVFNVGLTAYEQQGSSLFTSSTLVLTVSPPVVPPTIASPPASQTVTQGQSASFSVTATGTAPLAYQWRFQGANLTGQTSSNLVVTAAGPANAGGYTVVVSNSGGSVTSAVATLTVLVPPAITVPPVSQIVTQGQAATFSVAASGTAPLAYQWRWNGSALSGQTGSTLAWNPVTTNNAGNYDVMVSNAAGSVTSSVVSLAVVVPILPPVITAPPASLTVTQGQSAGFSVAAGGTAPLSYQWRFNGGNLAGQTAPTLVINPATTNTAGGYDVVISNSAGAVTSQVASLTVFVPGIPLQIISQPVSLTVTQGQSASFSVAAAGVGPLSYQWRFQGANLAGQTGAALLINAATTNSAGGYDAVVSNSSGSVTSAVVTLTVLVPAVAPTLVIPPASLTVTQGSNATFSVSATGTAPLGYYWRKGSTILAGPTGSSFTLTNVQAADAGSYSVIVSNSAGTAISPAATLTVQAAPQPPSIASGPVDVNVLPGGPATFTVLASGTQPFSYQWYFNGEVLPGRTASTLTIATVQPENLGTYFVVVRNTYGSAASGNARLGLIMLAGTYAGLFYPGGAAIPQNSGYFKATVTSQRNYSGKLTLFGRQYSLSGTFDAAGQAANRVTRGALSAVDVQLELDLTGADQIRGVVTDGSWTAALTANRAVYSPADAAPEAGVYTLVISGVPGATNAPAGDGFGTVNVDSSGNVLFKGTLADGSRISQATTLSKSGAWPLYVWLPSSQELLLGWLVFTNRTLDDVNGSLIWNRGQQPSASYYPAGFAWAAEAIGSRYAAPPAGTSVLGFQSGWMGLEGGNLALGITNRVQLGGSKITSLSGPGVALSVNPATGLFKGRVTDPANGRAITVGGAVLQKQNGCSGFFLGTSQSGRVLIAP